MSRTENIIYLGVLIFLVAAFVSGIRAETPSLDKNQDVATRKEKSKEMLRYMNLSVNPCEDFYEYACGNWVTNHESEVITATSILKAKIDDDLQKLLEKQVTLDDRLNGRKVKEFYESCVNAEHNGVEQQTFFGEFIKAYGGFPAVPGSNWQVHNHNYNWHEVVAQLRYNYGMDILIGLTVDINYQNKMENSIYLEEPSTFLPPELCSREGTKLIDVRDPVYEQIEKIIAERLMKWLTINSSIAGKLAADLVTFENELCMGMESKLEASEIRPDSGVNLNFTRKTLYEFSHKFNDSIDFNRFVAISFDHPANKPVFMRSESYFAKLTETIPKYSIETVANYIMYRALSYLSFPQDDHPSKRPKHCISQLKKYFPKLLGEMYYRDYGSQNAKTDIEAIYENIKQSLELSLNSKWIDDYSRRQSTQKLRDIRVKFPTYENLTTSEVKITHNYWHNLQQMMFWVQKREFYRLYETGTQSAPPQLRDPIESYDEQLKYRPLHKQLDIAWGILQPPIYQTSYSTSLKYSTIGVKLARELSFAFNQKNSKSNIPEHLPWVYGTADQYSDRVSCFQQQMSNYLFNKPDQLRNSNQVFELIASSNGLNVAFQAYLRWLSYMSPINDYAVLIKETLPDLNLNNTQLFFVAFAQMGCRAHWRNRVPTPSFFPLQKHTLERFGINGPLKNSIEFAREFNCLLGSEMNPADKCVIF